MALSESDEKVYYVAFGNDGSAVSALSHRDVARDHMKDGNLYGALKMAQLSIEEAKDAVGHDTCFQRELYASLGMAARVYISCGLRSEALDTAKSMDDMDLGLYFESYSLDQYEVTFWAARAAARYSGNLRDRLKGVGSAAIGATIVSPYAESTRYINFPNRDESFGWRLKKKAQFIGRNVAALGANMFRSEKLAKLAVK